MFTTANELSGIERKTFPTELIPLNTIQLARGLLNFTLLQTSRDWVFPFWAEQQFNPASISFVPRSHLGLSMNITHRNWTGVGNPGCPVEPIVDPRGLVMPFPNSWSIDVWLVVDQKILFPSRAPSVSQSLLDASPVVETIYSFEGMTLQLTATTVGSTLFHEALLKNPTQRTSLCSLIFAVRPFNPEGISPVHEITYDGSTASFRINKEHTLAFSKPPGRVHCSTYEGGDSARNIQKLEPTMRSENAYCPIGMANSFAAFDYLLQPTESQSVRCICRLDDSDAIIAGPDFREQAASFWAQTLDGGTTIVTPEKRINALVRSSVTTLLMLTDSRSITPGPYTYHHFWFRDAAYMLRALDVFGFFSFTKPVLSYFQERQEPSGYFRSQQGEWDSNGQALWTAWQHGVLSHDESIYEELWDSLKRGAGWIDNRRLSRESFKGMAHEGLMPAGLSAEHLGLADYYFWDNFWSVAGLIAYARICKHLRRHSERNHVESVLLRYERDVRNAIARATDRLACSAIPAAPARGIDCGMIGSCSAWYPLQLFPPDDPRLAATLTTLMDRFFVQGMFFQEFIHSGMNPYLTLQIAQSWLYAGKRAEFWKLLKTVVEHASPTLNYPEAIHPLTNGGAMGDGHHGWAAAEIALAFREAFIHEQWSGSDHVLFFLRGIPGEWFYAGTSLSITHAPIPGGMVDLCMTNEKTQCTFRLRFEPSGNFKAGKWFLRLPFRVMGVEDHGSTVSIIHRTQPEADIELRPGDVDLTIFKEP